MQDGAKVAQFFMLQP